MLANQLRSAYRFHDKYGWVVEESTREAVEGVPIRPLRSVISRYRGYHRVGPSGVHRGLPSSALTFVISLADPVDVRGLPEAGRNPGAIQAFVAGLHTGPAEIHHDGLQFGIQMDVTPLGARRLFGVPAGELAQLVVPLDELFGSGSPLLVERLDAARSWPDRFCVLDEVLARRLDDTGAAHPAVAEAWAALARGGGDLTVSTLATQVGYSRRHLAELFNRDIVRLRARTPQLSRTRWSPILRMAAP
jgi:hypothetical protein